MENPTEIAARLAAIVESSDDAIVSKTLDGIITSWNAGAYRLFGYTPEEAIGRSILLIIPEDRHAEERQVLDQLKRGQKVDHFETVRITKDGRLIPISLTVSPVRNADGEIVGASKIARDISLAYELATERQKLLEISEESNRVKDRFLAMLGHELRNPLSVIQNAADLLDRANIEATAGPRAMLQRQLGHLRRLVDDLLDASRIRSGKIALMRQPVNLADAAERSIAAFRSQPNLRHPITTHCAPVWVNADPTRLEQIIVNLCSNALRFTPDEKRIQVRVFEEDKNAVLCVEDEGIGISEGLLPHVFELYVQGKETPTQVPSGLGIGLSLVRTLTELHGGSVTASSAGLGRGSTFTVRLPKLLAIPPSHPALLAPPQKRRRVLLVEDNDDVRATLRDLLLHQNHEVYEAANGSEGVRLAAEAEPHLILVDLGLPGLDGWEVARQIRRLAVQPRCLIALSGYGGAEARQKCLHAGFDEHLLKPLQHDQLSALLETC